MGKKFLPAIAAALLLVFLSGCTFQGQSAPSASQGAPASDYPQMGGAQDSGIAAGESGLPPYRPATFGQAQPTKDEFIPDGGEFSLEADIIKTQLFKFVLFDFNKFGLYLHHRVAGI